MGDTIFTKIIKGEIPSHKIYEDNHSLAIIDIKPIQEGMVVVISKEQKDNLEDLSDETAKAMIITAKKIMKALRSVYPEKQKIALRVEGLEVNHAHMVIYPINSAEEFKAEPSKDEPDHEKLSQVALKIKEALYG